MPLKQRPGEWAEPREEVVGMNEWLVQELQEGGEAGALSPRVGEAGDDVRGEGRIV